MRDIGKALLAKTDTIVENWIDIVRQEVDIESAKGLAYKSVRNSIPLVVEAVATLLSESLENRTQKLEHNSLEHGFVRAEQGYDAAEIVQEYRLLRKVIFSILKPDLLSGSPEELLQTIETMDSVIDYVISISLQGYVETRLQEIEQVQGQLMLTNQELTRLVATQKENISHLAHELKNPLNSIMGFSTLLLQQQQKAIKSQDTSLNLQLIDRVLKNSRELLRLINDALEMSRYEAGQMQLNLEKVNVRSLIMDAVEALEPSARDKNLQMVINCELAPEQVQTDSLRLQQIINNLASNAIRYTESGTIEITCQMSNDDRWSLIVADTGIGLSPESQAQVFLPYYRVASEDGYLPQSTGLGLAIVAKLVELLQGEITLVSTLGVGSTFTVILPLAVETAS
jgi:signal transduction histidine kinase